MLGNFLNKSKPINFIGLLILFFASFFFTFFTEILEGTFSFSVVLKQIFHIVLLLTIFFFFNFVITKNSLTFDNSFAFYIFILLAICLIPILFEENRILFLCLQILFYRKVYSLKSSTKILQKLFDAGFWLGVFLLFSSDGILLFSLLFLSLIIHQKLTIQTLLAPIFGFIVPLIIYFSYLFWFDLPEDFLSFFTVDFHRSSTELMDKKVKILFYTILIISTIALIAKSAQILPISNTFRRSWFVLIFHFALGLFLLLFVNANSINGLIYLLFPISLILANGIELIQQRIVKDVVLYGLLISSVVYFFSL